MKKTEYPLEQLELIKKKKLEEAEKILHEKKRLLEAEEIKLHAVEKERDTVKEHKTAKLEQLRATLDEGTTTDKIQQMKQYLKLVQEQLQQKEAKVKEQLKVTHAAKDAVEAARVEYLQKHTDVEKLKIHRKEWEKQMHLEMEKAEAIESDEMGTSRHIAKKMKKRKE